VNELLQIGQTVRDASGAEWRAEQFIGAGGQGEVYRASRAGHDHALKWYFPDAATAEQKSQLERLVLKGPPDPRFLWPLAVVEAGHAGFGYVMPLREARFRGVRDLFNGQLDPSLRVLATVGFHLSDAFHELHAAGLCYRDISFGNAFLDPAKGEVAICDNDNVTIDDGSWSGVLGTAEFMAPEVVMGRARPSADTDRHSLAVLLFYLFHVHHPLYGKRMLDIHCLDWSARRRLCGAEPLFIFDPTDDSNRAVGRDKDPIGEAGANALLYWPIYPSFLREAFLRAFSAGLHDPQHGRVRETEWRRDMVRLRDAVFYCHHCGAENFYDERRLRETGEVGSCWRPGCGQALRLPYRMRLRSSVVLLRHDSLLFPHHVDPGAAYDFSAPVAEVAIHPGTKLWGLRNLGRSPWTAQAPEGSLAAVPPRTSVTLVSGLKINFGHTEGEVRL
jgi:hypothetical protein